RLAAQVRDHPVVVGWYAEDVGAQPPDRARIQLQYRSVPQSGLLLGPAEHEPRPSKERSATRNDAPAAAHTQVAANDAPALEAEEQVLPDCLDGEQLPTVDLVGDAGSCAPRMRALRLDPLADEHLEPAGRPVQGIALGHPTRVSARRLPSG